MPSARVTRCFAVLTLVAALPLFAACGGSNNNKPAATPTATHSHAPTATATETQATTSTATAVASATSTRTVSGATATATLTGVATVTATATETTIVPSATATLASVATVTATATATTVAPTATATLTSIATFTTTPTATGVPTGTATATVTPTGVPTGTASATATATFTATALPTGTTAATATPTPTVTPGPVGIAHGSVGQVYVTDALPNVELNLIGPDSSVIQNGTTDAKGSIIFRNVPVAPVGTGYTVQSVVDPDAISGPVTVTAWDKPPDPSLYQDQAIGPGYGYLKTRDGTLISIMVYLPGPPDKGPYPTVIEYSGYTPAWPDHPQPSTQITSAIGYAAVGVNIRGTGCSGGAYDYFEPLQSTDGYDVIETIAAQPWVLNHQVGMVGISFPGITQLFVAQLQPPHLAAIAPLSVISDTGRGTLYPGGILNDGFAVSWATDRQDDAMPYPNGQAWSVERINDGDQVCLNNQKLRLQAPNIMEQIDDNSYYVPAVADPLTPATFVHNINVPVFLAGAWEDEQVGGYFATMLDQFTGTDKLHFTMVNGNHTEPLIPSIFARWLEFLSFYVRREIPQTTAIEQVAMDVIGSQAFTNAAEPLPAGVFTLPPDRFTAFSSYDEALAMFESEPHVRVLFDDGAVSDQPGAPIPSFEYSFPSWPVVPYDAGTAWYFADDGALVSDAPTVDSADPADSFAYDSSNSQTTTFHGSNGDDIWLSLPPWDWKPLTIGKAVAYATAPLDADIVMVGSGSVDLWVQATAPDVDVQVTLSEIRPDGQEVYVQSGWGRASFRKLDETQSTELRPVETGLEMDLEPLPPGQYVLGRVELFPFGHAFRKGSRIRISVEPPGGDRPLWQFQALDVQATIDIAHSVANPSRIVLPVVPGLVVPTGLPPCPGLRGQPCRSYDVNFTNTPG